MCTKYTVINKTMKYLMERQLAMVEDFVEYIHQSNSADIHIHLENNLDIDCNPDCMIDFDTKDFANSSYF